MQDEFKVNDEEVIDDMQLPSVVISANDAFEAFNKLTYRRPRVNRIVQLWLTGSYSTAEIADIVDVSKDTVQKWLRRREIKEYISAHQAEELAILKTKMASNADKAFQKMVDLLDSNIDNVALQASKDILDRTGFKPVNEVKSEVVHKTYEQQLKDMLASTSIDVEYEVVEDEVD